jgi:hypothetical protein
MALDHTYPDMAPGPDVERGSRNRVAILALVAAVVVVVIALTFRPVVDGDGVGYYSYLHSVVIDHNLDFTNEYAAARAAHATVYSVYLETRTPTGLLANYYPVGSAVLALPFYLAALALHPDGQPLFGPPFTWAYTLASLLYGLLALVICLRLTRSIVAVAAAALATPFVYYLLDAPSYSHTFSAFAVALFVWAWLSGRGPIALGLLAGLMALVRPQDGLLGAIALLETRRWGLRTLLLVPSAGLVFLPQVAADYVLWGGPLPHGPPEGFTPIPGHYFDVLFSTLNGLFTWHPATLISVVGILFVRNRKLQVAIAYALLVETLINGAVGDWWGGFAFGGRRFLDLLPFFAIGYAALVERLRPAAAWAATAALISWNGLLMANWAYVIKTGADPGLRIVTGQLEAIRYVPRLFFTGYPVRALVLGPVAHQSFDLVGGLAMLAVIAVIVYPCVFLSSTSGLRSEPWTPPWLETDAAPFHGLPSWLRRQRLRRPG